MPIMKLFSLRNAEFLKIFKVILCSFHLNLPKLRLWTCLQLLYNQKTMPTKESYPVNNTKPIFYNKCLLPNSTSKEKKIPLLILSSIIIYQMGQCTSHHAAHLTTYNLIRKWNIKQRHEQHKLSIHSNAMQALPTSK